MSEEHMPTFGRIILDVNILQRTVKGRAPHNQLAKAVGNVIVDEPMNTAIGGRLGYGIEAHDQSRLHAGGGEALRHLDDRTCTQGVSDENNFVFTATLARFDGLVGDGHRFHVIVHRGFDTALLKFGGNGV